MKLIFTIQLLIFCNVLLIGQIQDGNFDQWDTAYHYMYSENGIFEIVPSVWESNNETSSDVAFLFSMPATRSEESPIDAFSLKLESSALGIDASYSGILYQDISLENLSEISYIAKCDSLSRNSGCFVEIFGFDHNEDLELIYQDSIVEEDEFFSDFLIEVGEFSATNFDSIRLQFRAKGVGGFEDDHLLGHTIFLIDGVESNYLTNTNELNKNHLILSPNPASHFFKVVTAHKTISQVRVYDTIGSMNRVLNCNSRNCVFDMNGLSEGVYNVLIEFANGTAVFKRVIKSDL